jgi:hypothetical protein
MPKPVIDNPLIATAIMVHWSDHHQTWSILHYISMKHVAQLIVHA